MCAEEVEPLSQRQVSIVLVAAVAVADHDVERVLERRRWGQGQKTAEGLWMVARRMAPLLASSSPPSHPWRV